MIKAIILSTLAAQLLLAPPVIAETITRAHGIALHGELKYPENFTHFDYVNPDAPKGGTITLMGHGNFDSLNPYTLKGTSPFNSPGLYAYGITEQSETLLVGSGSYLGSGDEPQSAYGLIAESLEYPADRSWVIFHLRKEARFHDGSAITADDVVFSFETLMRDGHPRYQNVYRNVEKVEKLSPLSVRFTFNAQDNRMMPLRVGELPVISKQWWSGRDFAKASIEPPLLSGPYRVTDVKSGQHFVLERVKDYWGNHLAVNRGRNNFDRIRFDFYKNLTVSLEAFKSGAYDIHLEYISKNWNSAYDHPAVRDGRIIKAEIPHQIAQGSQAFFFNLRREQFKDRRTREALSMLFDFEWTNRNIFSDAYARAETYYPNSELGARGLPSADELSLLEPHRDAVPQDLFLKPFRLSRTDGSGNVRPQLRTALRLLKQAGWSHQKGKLVNEKTGNPFRFEILIYQQSTARLINPWVRNLERAGIDAVIRNVDSSQFKRRLDQFDFDVTIYVLPQSLSPGAEQREYFHSEMADVKGGRNLPGIRNSVVDYLVDQIIEAPDRNALVTRTHALDRVLLWEHYSIPHWFIGHHRVAYWDKFGKPAIQPPYRLGFENWWHKEQP